MNIKSTIRSAVENYQAGNLQHAENILKKVLKKLPNNAEILYLLGVVYAQIEKYDLAIQYITKSLLFDTNNAEAHLALAMAFQHEGLTDKAILHYEKAINLNPNNAEAYIGLGLAVITKGQPEEAITYYQKALQLNPHLDEAYARIGLALQEKKQFDEAISCHRKAVELNPNNLIALYGLGTALEETQQFDEAITYYQKALQLNPNDSKVYNNLGAILQKKEQFDEAITYYQKALQMNSNDANAYSNLGGVIAEKGQIDEAISCYKKALQINPDLDGAYIRLTSQLQQICNWRELEVMNAKCDALNRKALAKGRIPAETPFMNIRRHDDPSINFAIAKAYSRDIARAMSIFKIRFSFDVRGTRKTKIVVGYLSNDFRDHATAHLMLSLFGLHNRDEFVVYCYSYGKDDGSYYGERIQRDCDKFIDISSLSYEAAAKCIYGDQVDILVDLKGYTKSSRLEICALRPAPIQVSYLGFPGTTGADFIDYIITDKIVTPKDHTSYYSEKFVYMPHCYQVNDHTQPISNKDWKRGDFGLPESCFVFCSFNLQYKIDPVMFDIWMRILQQVPEGVLWFTFGNKIVEENLRREAEARGVKSERLIFGKVLPKDEHLARLRLADLALDTRIVNGHTTTSDALYAGVPLITLQGNHFASRVSASILSSMDLPELITYRLEEYETLAVRLAHNPFKLKEIRQRIAKNRIVAPLFDTPRFVRNLETAYKEMWKIFLSGETIHQIEVLES